MMKVANQWRSENDGQTCVRSRPDLLGRLLGADALIYGQVDSYQGFYFMLLSVPGRGDDVDGVDT
jgi:hypothetical protein